MSEYIEWSALGQVIGVGLLVGAGLPALFALGLRLLSPARRPADGAAPEVPAPRPAPWRVAVACLCFGIIVAAVVAGIAGIVAGGH